jgi:hypothetical protein
MEGRGGGAHGGQKNIRYDGVNFGRKWRFCGDFLNKITYELNQVK